MTTKENLAAYNKVRNTALKRLRLAHEAEYLALMEEEANNAGLNRTPRKKNDSE